ncbi:hypothetical protein Pka01_17640 [Planotetraspora kaengkrachanensis]|uniref:Uncharacterized protein n=1 Tax=Planotetraspora kaengkrachanensis TaxID=575193 RepID=A0A8J3LUQ4_9ACTN|nr:hypothetical protein Pka01_17640 [Planotetraspora kaengkrachanensis]
MRAFVIGLGEEAAVHVRVPARLEAQQFAQAIDVRVADREHALVRYGRAFDGHRRVADDPERLPSGVVIRGGNLSDAHTRQT